MAEAIEVRVPPAEVDLASGLLWGCGVSAVVEREEVDGVVLATDVPAGGLASVEAALGGRWPVRLSVVDDGLDAWRAHATVTRAGRLVVVPPWIGFEPGDGDVVLLIDPGHSFGHGAHPTTRACLAEVERLVEPGGSVLDAGCGSGVLAVAASLLGSARVVAVDVDRAAIEATRENAALNDVHLEVTDQPLAAITGPFDLVLANIGAATLVELSDRLQALTDPAGTLVLSGLLAGQIDRVSAAYPSWDTDAAYESEGWITLSLRRGGRRDR